MKRKAIATMMIFAFFALALVINVPCALSARPPVSPWPPEEKWDPMPPEEVRPSYQAIPVWYPGEYELKAGDSFWLSYGWLCMPTNVMYDYYTAEETTVPISLQDHTDQANCIYTVTMNDKSLEPTGKFTGTCQWLRLYFAPEVIYIVPKAIWREYFIEFPQGLAAGTYVIEVCGKPCWGEPFSYTVTLYVTT